MCRSGYFATTSGQGAFLPIERRVGGLAALTDVAGKTIVRLSASVHGE